MVEVLDDRIPIHYQNHIKNLVKKTGFELAGVTDWESIRQFIHDLISCNFGTFNFFIIKFNICSNTGTN